VRSARIRPFLLPLPLTLPVLAQQPGPLADIEILRVKPGTDDQFQAAQKKHWEWHKRQGDSWPWFVWTVESGSNMGAYVVASFAHPWQEIDRENTILAGKPEPEGDTDPFHDSVQESFWVYRPDLSCGGDIAEPAPVASLTRYLLRPGSASDFEAGLKRLKETTKKCAEPPANASRWYELVTGGEKPQFILLEDRANWASFQNPDSLDSMMKDSKGKLDANILSAFWTSAPLSMPRFCNTILTSANSVSRSSTARKDAWPSGP